MSNHNIDLSAFEHTKDNFDPETGHEIPDFVDVQTVLATLDDSLSEFAVVLQNFMSDYQQTVHEINMRFARLEKIQENTQTILQLVAQRSDWFMQKNPDCAIKEHAFLQEQKELYNKAKEQAHEQEALSVPSVPE